MRRYPFIITVGANKDISAATGQTIFFLVPTGRVYLVYSVWREGTTGNSQIVLSAGGDSNSVATLLSTAEQVFLPQQPIPLRPGGSVKLQNTNNAGDSNRYASLMYESISLEEFNARV